jgi:hypothetical protein
VVLACTGWCHCIRYIRAFSHSAVCPVLPFRTLLSGVGCGIGCELGTSLAVPQAPRACHISGTLTGDGVRHKNNSVSVTCYKTRQECIIFEVDQIGPNQIGRLDAPHIYPIGDGTNMRLSPQTLLICGVAGRRQSVLSGKPKSHFGLKNQTVGQTQSPQTVRMRRQDGINGLLKVRRAGNRGVFV